MLYVLGLIVFAVAGAIAWTLIQKKNPTETKGINDAIGKASDKVKDVIKEAKK